MMPAMTMLGWFHTIMGVLALLLATAAKETTVLFGPLTGRVVRIWW